jgi:hypothetical protein
VLWVPPTASESAIEHTRSGAEQPTRTTAEAILAAAQNGTSCVLADVKRVQRRAAWRHARTSKRYRATSDPCSRS